MQLWAFLQESQNKWRKSEDAITEKEKELELLASKLASLTLMFDKESKKVNFLEQQLKELKEQETIKCTQISSFQQDIVKLRFENSNLKQQAHLKQLAFDKSMDLMRAELKQHLAALENLSQEKEALKRDMMNQEKVFENLQHDYRHLESEMSGLDEQLKCTLTAESTCRDSFEEQMMIREIEEDFFMTYINEQMNVLRLEVTRYTNMIGKPARSEIANDMEEMTWRLDVETSIIGVVMDGWYNECTELLQKLMFVVAYKEEEILYRDGQVVGLKQAVQDLENDYATLMSIVLTLIGDQNDDESMEPAASSTHEYGKRKLMELNDVLNAKATLSRTEEKCDSELDVEEELAAQQLQRDLNREIVSKFFIQDRALECHKSGEMPANFEGKALLHEELASEQFRHNLELEIVCEVIFQKYNEVLDMVLSTKLSNHGSMQAIGKDSCSSFEELEVHLESFIELEACRRELEACRLERIRTGCSTSIAKCEFKLDKLMKDLADQVNEMKAKISILQDAVKQQEWKHMLEEDILIFVLCNALIEMDKSLKLEEASQLVHYRLDMFSDHLGSPSDRMSDAVSPHDSLPMLETDDHGSQKVDYRLGSQDKDKLVLLLRKTVEDLRKEKTVNEQKLEKTTEELYSLKRQLWKEREIWVSQLSMKRQAEEVHSLSRHSCKAVDLEAQLSNKLEEVRFDASVSGLKDEWPIEKESLLSVISQKEEKIEGLGAEIVRLRERERNSKATEASHLARIAELKTQVDNLSADNLIKEFQFVKGKQEWKIEKESMKNELNELAEKERLHKTSEECMSARITELETQTCQLSARISELETQIVSSEQAKVEHESLTLQLKKEIEEEREHLTRLESEKKEREHLTRLELKKEIEEEREHLTRLESEKKDLIVKVGTLSQEAVQNAKIIEKLEAGKDILTRELLDKELFTAQLIEEKNILLALADKEKSDEEKTRKSLELLSHTLRLEVSCLNDKVGDLEGRLMAIPRQLQCELVDSFSESALYFEQTLMQKMQVNSIRYGETGWISSF
ncbi:hypothetical protein KP509_38G032400 [Ceratopteris richardii]|nr:hypothetical protein KP509_38G032400 [Ceratopteris richardii]